MVKDDIDAAAENGGEARCFVCCHGKAEGKLSVDVSTGSVEWRSAHGATIRVNCVDILGARLASRETTGVRAYVSSWFTSSEYGRSKGAQDVLVLSVVERRGAKSRVRDEKLVFSSADECSRCCQCIGSLLNHLNRPKSLLVFINPYGGKKRGCQVYEQEVAPVFAVAGIRTNVVVTQHSNEARDLLKDKANDLSVYDGIVVVGGDGTLAEVVLGLMLRVNAQIRPGDDIPTIELPVGLIPAGTGNIFAFETTGAVDPVTSALHIACGNQISTDAATVFSGDDLQCLAASTFSYGTFSEVVAGSERYRWLGPLRLLAVLVNVLWRIRPYRGSVTFWPAGADSGHPLDGQVCTAGCSRCSKPPLPGEAPPELETELAKAPFERLPDGSIRIHGSFTMVGSSVHATRYDR